MWGIIALIILIPLGIAGLSFAPWSPTTFADVKRLKKILKKNPGKKFLEFGCGDARVCHAIAKAFPDTEVLWVEIAYPIYFIAKLKQFIYPLKNLKIQLWSWFKQDFSKFDTIYMYGMPDAIAKKVLPKFEKEAKKGTRLISYVFSFKNTKRKIEKFEKKDRRTIHVLTK